MRKTVERMQKEEEVRGVVVSCEAEFERELSSVDRWQCGRARRTRRKKRSRERRSDEKLLGREYLESE